MDLPIPRERVLEPLEGVSVRDPTFLDILREHYDYNFRALGIVTAVLLVGGFSVVAFGVSGSWAAGILWSLAWLILGWTVGFVFSISRTVEPDRPAQAFEQRVNTNLEQISDWLTKILVGLGLTQLNEIPKRLQEASWQVAEALGSQQQRPFALGLIIYFSVVGFLSGYLMTRLHINNWLLQAEKHRRTKPE